MSSRPCGAPPRRTPTRFIASNYKLFSTTKEKWGDNAYVVCSIAVIIYSAEEGGSSIFTDVLGQKMSATRVFIKEVRHVMNETSNADQWARLGLGQIYT